ncbi:hypothetical protein HQ585_10820 [candidate division KSB1 bacterium]|nr:hypothetical protein [candidate division KSB1 bacterium]
MIRFFLAGIIQGSHQDNAVHDQSYRDRIRQVIEEAFIDSSVYCPVEEHPDSVTYDDNLAQKVFHRHIQLVREADVLIVFLPEASMGSGIEMWEAKQHHTFTVAITAMQANWVVRLFSNAICRSIEDFEAFMRSGAFNESLDRFQGK